MTRLNLRSREHYILLEDFRAYGGTSDGVKNEEKRSDLWYLDLQCRDYDILFTISRIYGGTPNSVVQVKIRCKWVCLNLRRWEWYILVKISRNYGCPPSSVTEADCIVKCDLAICAVENVTSCSEFLLATGVHQAALWRWKYDRNATLQLAASRMLHRVWILQSIRGTIKQRHGGRNIVDKATLRFAVSRIWHHVRIL